MTNPQYPTTDNFGYSASSWEIRLGRNIYTMIANLAHNQPLTEGIAFANGQPMLRTRGVLGMGEGTLEWSDVEEAQKFRDDLGECLMEKIFAITETLTCPRKPPLVYLLGSCRILDVEVDHEGGENADPLGEGMPFSFMWRKFNGKLPMINQRT